MSDGHPTAILTAASIAKGFGGVSVLEDVSFDIRRGEIHTLMGENGAGKSTLMKIIAGVHSPDAGQIIFDGKPAVFPTPQAAIRAGIALIHQEPLSFPDLSIAENIFLGRGLPRSRFGRLDWHAMNDRAAELLGQLGVTLDPTTPMRGLSVADQQMVELAAALSLNARVLLMDEPTAALTPREVDELFRIVKGLKAKGVAIVFVSHRLPEVFEVSDRITVLRDGRCIGTKLVRETSKDEIVRMMVGRELNSLYERRSSVPGKTLLQVTGLTRAGQFQDIHLTVRAGEIVGIAGLVGAGRTEVAEGIFGVRSVDAGTVQVDGKTLSIKSPKDAIRHGIAYVPEDRQHNGLLLPMSIASNTSIADLPAFATAGVISTGKERSAAQAWKEKLSTRLRDVDQPARELSGGNQQKVVLAKWLQTDPQVLIVDEPTRGIDIGAKAEVHHVLAELARQGRGILMISSDLPEVLAMSDRVLVMRSGRIAAEFTREEATQEKVMGAATGTTRSTLDEAFTNRDSHQHAPLQTDRLAPPLAATSSDVRTPELAASGAAKQGEKGASANGRNTASSLLLKFRELGLFVFIVLAFAIISFKEPRMCSAENLRTIALNPTLNLMLIIAVGQLMVMANRNIDLSVGSIVGLSAMVAGGLFISHPAMPLWVGALIAVGVGGILGAINGGLIAFARVPAIITTLGTMTAYRGLIYIWAQGKQVNKNQLPALLSELSTSGPMSIPWIVWFVIITLVLAALFLRFTQSGREIFAIGSNPNAATLRGINVKRSLLLIFTITGVLSGFAGFLFPSRLGTISASSVGQSYELVVISAVVIGGASVNGGTGTVLGTFLGCLLLAVLNVALTMLKISEFWQIAVYGAAILLACTTDAFLRKRGAAGGAT